MNASEQKERPSGELQDPSVIESQAHAPSTNNGRKPTLRIETASISGSSRDEVATSLKNPKQDGLEMNDGIRMSDEHGTNARTTLPGKRSSRMRKVLERCIHSLGLSWATNNFDMAHLKPVIRASVALWLSLVLMLIRPTEDAMGNVRSYSFQ